MALTPLLLPVAQPLTGIISDRWRSAKYGRRHPFLLIAPVPVAACTFAIFTPPQSLLSGVAAAAASESGGGGGAGGQLSLFGWLAWWTVCSRAFLTLYSVPHAALGGELSKNQHQRSQVRSAEPLLTLDLWTCSPLDLWFHSGPLDVHLTF